MENKAQKNSIILAILGFTGVVVIAGLIGYLTIGKSDDVIQGESSGWKDVLCETTV